MAPSDSSVADNKAKTSGKDVPVPPDERFWQRYSPHHEFPLSSVSSLVLHGLILLLLGLAAFIAFKLGLSDTAKSPPVQVVEMAGGGGGQPDGVEGGHGEAGAHPREDTGSTNPDAKTTPEVKLDQLPDGDLDPLTLPDFKAPDGTRFISEGNKQLEALAKLPEDARKKLFGPVAAKGKGGPGDGGGSGAGHGTGTGNGTGPGKGQLSEHQKRLLRWTMTFNTQNGEDYARQLAGIKPGTGAILAIPGGDGHQYTILRDLSARPARGEVEDISQIKRIYWVDDKPQSVAGLARALGIPAPPYFVAFFPAELEDELVRIEHAYQNRAEDDIYETRFDVVRTSDGYRPKVSSQKGK